MAAVTQMAGLVAGYPEWLRLRGGPVMPRVRV